MRFVDIGLLKKTLLKLLRQNKDGCLANSGFRDGPKVDALHDHVGLLSTSDLIDSVKGIRCCGKFCPEMEAYRP